MLQQCLHQICMISMGVIIGGSCVISSNELGHVTDRIPTNNVSSADCLCHRNASVLQLLTKFFKKLFLLFGDTVEFCKGGYPCSHDEKGNQGNTNDHSVVE